MKLASFWARTHHALRVVFLVMTASLASFAVIAHAATVASAATSNGSMHYNVEVLRLNPSSEPVSGLASTADQTPEALYEPRAAVVSVNGRTAILKSLRSHVVVASCDVSGSAPNETVHCSKQVLQEGVTVSATPMGPVTGGFVTRVDVTVQHLSVIPYEVAGMTIDLPSFSATSFSKAMFTREGLPSEFEYEVGDAKYRLRLVAKS